MQKTCLPLTGNVLKPVAKSILIPLWLTAAANVATHKKILGSGKMTLIILNEERNDIMKIVKSLEEFGLLMKDISKTIKNEAKKWKGRFLGTLLGILGASLVGNLLTCKGTSRAGEDTVRTCQDF